MSHQLLCCGNANDLAAWSNIPYFLLQAGRQQGLLTSGVTLDPQRLRWQRRLWNLQQWLKTGRPGGFQYSNNFLSRLWNQAALEPCFPEQPRRLLSHYPHLPPAPWPDHWQISFYIDATTKQVFKDYGAGMRIDPVFQQAVIQRETASFHAAKAVITMSEWAAASVCQDYGVPRNRVHVVPGGANLDETALALVPPTPVPQPPSPQHPLRLGFLGKEWERKGGPFVLAIAEALQRVGVPAEVRAIGPEAKALPSHPLLQPLGFINKRTQMAEFVSEVRSWHFGTLFSSSEAFGISNRECLRLGVPVLTHAVGGIPSTLHGHGCGQLFSAHPSPETVACWLHERLSPYSAYQDLRRELQQRAVEFSWGMAVGKLKEILE